MKLASIALGDTDMLGVSGLDGRLLDAGRLVGRPELTMNELVDDATALLPKLKMRLEEGPAGEEFAIPEREVRWRPPMRRPSKIVGVAVNNELFHQWSFRRPSEPAYFVTPPSALVGHREAIVIKPDYGLTHPEPELAAVIGQRAAGVTAAQAHDVVFGFSVFNDVTSPSLKARDSMELVPPAGVEPELAWRQQRGPEDRSLYLTYHARSKGCDTFAPMGPWIVTRDEIPDPNCLSVRGWLADEEVLADSTAHLAFPVEEVLSHLSSYMTLEPGDIVHFGTAARVTSPQHTSLWSLDLATHAGPVAIEIEGVGRLENPITVSRTNGAHAVAATGATLSASSR